MSDVWNSSKPFVYTMHTTCGMTLKTLRWERPSTPGEKQRPMSVCYWCVLVKRTYHGAITISLMSLVFISIRPSVSLPLFRSRSFPFPFLPNHHFLSYFLSFLSILLSFLPSFSQIKFHVQINITCKLYPHQLKRKKLNFFCTQMPCNIGLTTLLCNNLDGSTLGKGVRFFLSGVWIQKNV